MIWDLNKKELLKKLLPMIGEISYLEFIFDSSQIIIGSAETNCLEIWVEENGLFRL